MKRTISVITALMLIVSLIPAAFASDTGYEWARTPKTYVYEFNNASHTTTTAGANNWLHNVERDISYAVSGTQEWGFVGLQNFHNFYTTDTWLNMAAHVKEDGGTPYFGPGTNAPTGEFKTAFGLELDVDASGKYTPALTFKTGTSAPIVDVYLVEKPTDASEAADWYSEKKYNNEGVVNGLNAKNFYSHVESTDASNRIGVGINMYGETTVIKTVALSPVTLDASKNYFLLIVPCGIDENAVVEEYSSSAYDSAVIKLVSFALSEELTEKNAETLEYDITTNAIDKTVVQTHSTNNSYLYEYMRPNGTTLDNIRLANWKYTMTSYNIGSYSMTLANTAPYAIETSAGKIAGVHSGTLGSAGYQGTTYIAKYSNTSTDRPHVAIRLNIPYSGKYNLRITDGQANAGYDPFMQIYFGMAESSYTPVNVDSWIAGNEFLGWFSSSNWGTATDTTSGAMFSSSMKANEKGTSDTSTFVKNYAVDGFTVDIPVAGEYWVILNACADSLTLNNASLNDAGTYQYLRFSTITLTPLPDEPGEEETAIATVANTMTADIAEESAHSLSDTAYVNVLTTTVNSADDTSVHTATKYETVRGAELTVTAPEYDDYTFLYWTKGIGADRRVVSDSENYTLAAPAGGTYLTAVYKAKTDAQTSVVFFDASGNELSRALYNEGDNITFPSAPSLTDYSFGGWALAGSDGMFENASASGEQMIFVAQFSDEPTEKSVAVEVNGETTGYAYGSLVEVSATERENGNGSNVFLYWTKDGEIVSFDKSYSFLAAESCELEAVYGAYKPSLTASLRRIIVSGSFAEFIGLEDAKEKGVLFNKNGGGVSLETATHKIAVKNGGNQLKFENDLSENASIIGYAIIDDDTVIYGK